MNNPPRAASRLSSVSRVITGRWSSINSTGAREETLHQSDLFSASPEPETSNTEPRQRLRIFIRVRLLFQARAAEIFGVPYFQIFKIFEDNQLSSKVCLFSQHK